VRRSSSWQYRLPLPPGGVAGRIVRAGAAALRAVRLRDGEAVDAGAIEDRMLVL